MRKDEYGKYLENRLKPNSAKDRLSRCKSVEKALGVDLDEEYKKDGGTRVMEMLSYTIQDARDNKPLPAGLAFKPGANIIQRITDLRSAVKQYFAFCANG